MSEDRRFTVTATGETSAEPMPSAAPAPSDEDRRRAHLLARGGNFDSGVEDLFAQGIAVARSGGDVESFLREQLRKKP